MHDRDHARALITMADKDLKALTGMTDPMLFEDEIFGFHAQQAVEKTLKAWIAALDVDYPFTHDISRLLAILEEQGCLINTFWPLVEYNTFAVQFRYEVFENTEEPLDRPAMIGEIQPLMAHVRGIIEAPEGGP